MNSKSLKLLLLVAVMGIGGCSSAFRPFVGSKDAYAAPVESVQYNYEDISEVGGGSINGGCIPGVRGIDPDKVGKTSWGYNSQCGAAYLKKQWKPGMTADIYWKILPYPDWRAKLLPGGGVVHDEKELAVIRQYTEYPHYTIPLPPPPEGRMDFDKAGGIDVHFLACNQIFITYGTREERRNHDLLMGLMQKSMKLCRKRPVIKSMADYRKHKAEMDAIREERKQIPQVILPEYIKQLEAEGKLPHQQMKNKE
ncbi:DUF3304 domain-containing protein [Neisseriaceae bacterium ESL0693]|nr:DUF3304 domain-containing protein [Neisseriaceae bacterium ESL0693]